MSPWTCPECGRVFEKDNQPHSCKRVPLEKHFANKAKAKALFDALVAALNQQVGGCQVISIPCCVHLYGQYDFLAALPKKGHLEVRFATDHPIESPRVKLCVPTSAKYFKVCLDVKETAEIDDELIGWLRDAYYLKES